MLLCSNCGNYHCCNFRPVSASSTDKMLSTTTTMMTSPVASRDTLNQYQLARPISSMTQKGSLRQASPKKVHFQRPSSTSSTQSFKGKHFVFKKEAEPMPATVREQPILKRRTSPPKVLNIPRQNVSHSPKTIIQGSSVVRSPIRQKAIERVGASPQRINRMKSPSPTRVSPPQVISHPHRVSNLPKTINTLTHTYSPSPIRSNAHPISNILLPSRAISPAIIQHPPAPAQKPLLKSSVMVVNTSPSIPNSNIVFPTPSNAMVPETISKIHGSKVSEDMRYSNRSQSGYAQKSSEHSKNLDCSYNDNRCLGFDFIGEDKHQLKLDSTGHLKASLHN